jgi:hypothetical protein
MKTRERGVFAGSIMAALVLATASVAAFAQDAAVKSFSTYQAAASAFVEAVKAQDNAALQQILGAKAQSLLSSGDATQDENGRKAFLKHYDEKHAFVHDSADKVTMTVGTNAWPLPFPIVRANGAWHFDAVEGAQELVYRRIGHNELDAIKVGKALYTAQKQYAAEGHDGNPAGAYAQRILSQPGKQDGLYYETKEGEPTSPAGSLVADAASEGYQTAKSPFHGYYFRILKAQGSHAPGGAKDYVKDGQMTGGFAIVAYPAEYKASGVMTFVVNSHGTVREKDLGETTADVAKAMTAYDPDSSWKVVP